MVDTAVRLALAEHEDQALAWLMPVHQMPETDEPTLDAIRYLLHIRRTTEPLIAFAKIRLATLAAELAVTCDRDDLVDEFATECVIAWDYIEEHFIGTRYHNQFSLDEVLVLDVVNRGTGSWSDAVWVARLQDSVGHVTDESTEGLQGDPYELIESGESRRPRLDACSDGDHEFDPDEIRDFPSAAKCLNCNLSHGVVKNWLHHYVPERCADCGEVVYDVELRRGRRYCSDCVPS